MNLPARLLLGEELDRVRSGSELLTFAHGASNGVTAARAGRRLRTVPRGVHLGAQLRPELQVRNTVTDFRVVVVR